MPSLTYWLHPLRVIRRYNHYNLNNSASWELLHRRLSSLKNHSFNLHLLLQLQLMSTVSMRCIEYNLSLTPLRSVLWQALT